MRLFSRHRCYALALALSIADGACAQQPFFEAGFVARSNPQQYPTNAYPVIARLSFGRLLCVFSVSGTEKPAKLKIASSISDDKGKTWSAPAVLFDHPDAEEADPNLLIDGNRVLAFSTTVPLPARIAVSKIYMRGSTDGVHWGAERLLETPHKYIAGKIHQGHRLSDGTLIISYSWDTWADQGMPPATEGEMNIKSGVLRSTDGGNTWKPGADLYADIPKTSPHAVSGLDEAAVVVLGDGRLMTLMRTSGARLIQSWSQDGGRTWQTPRPSALTAHNSPAALWKLDGSNDVLVIWDNSPIGRTPLAAALSNDGGATWSAPKVIADTHGPEQASYPSAVQAKDGTLIAVWQQHRPDGGRDIRYARFNRAWLVGK
jgi:Neuraminidase (sialidase)